RPKIVYYSGRQGFRETTFAITAPLQMFYSDWSVRWSPMTLSHELMHGHVRDILSSIFSDGKDPVPSTKKFDVYAAEFRKAQSSGADIPNLKACLRHIIFNFCLWDDAVQKLLTKMETGGTEGVP